MTTGLSKENNFDMIRLYAALQVMLFHYYFHVHFTSPALNNIVHITKPFSGIIILFTVSGFLIFATYDNNPGIKNFFRNRFLRIYPCLWVCLLFTIVLLAASGYINAGNVFSKHFLFWLVTQFSFLQFYTPDMLRGFGVGCPNGSLWTVPVEVGFYLLVPVFFKIASRAKLSRNVWLIIFIALSIACNVYYQQYKFQPHRTNLVKLMGVNIAPYLFYFLLGAIAYVNWEKIGKWYKGKGMYWLAAYLCYYIIFAVWLHKFSLSYWTNAYHFIAVVLLSQTTISLAFTNITLSSKILRHNDISFGIYAYHMPVINALLALGFTGHDYTFAIALAIILLIAVCSWKFIELPALSMKKRTINKLPAQP